MANLAINRCPLSVLRVYSIFSGSGLRLRMALPAKATLARRRRPANGNRKQVANPDDPDGRRTSWSPCLRKQERRHSFNARAGSAGMPLRARSVTMSDTILYNIFSDKSGHQSSAIMFCLTYFVNFSPRHTSILQRSHINNLILSSCIENVK